MTSVLQALAAKQIEVETRKQQSHEQKSGRKHYEFSLYYMYFEELLPESFSTEL
ncbi:hypothetical protein PMN76_01235 [Blautia wexlerae]|uniref:hypothetical protein n=1 Tax=Blautia wexlerae TaxID=418240 RepID=UPI00232D7904|nr:hypothetical protein [Blautia wexlerae]MDB6479366.1 hypothetical protein [Blautia wexlerae]MDB6483535.1 hypothetical protein [Blautia wexlerae]